MYCPSCRSEFREGITTCAHCEVDLVAERPDEQPFASSEAMARALDGKELAPVLVGNYAALQEVQRTLADESIASVVARDSDAASEAAMHARFYLMVDEQQHEAARSVLQARWAHGLAREGTLVDGLEAELGVAEAGEVTRCPACDTVVPDDAEACPECELYLGLAASEGEEPDGYSTGDDASGG